MIYLGFKLHELQFSHQSWSEIRYYKCQSNVPFGVACAHPIEYFKSGALWFNNDEYHTSKMLIVPYLHASKPDA